MIDYMTLLIIVLMASVTYLTRIVGYVGLRNRELSPRTLAVMEAAPGCVLISVIAPHFAAGRPADLLSLVITLAVAARFSILPTIIIGIVSAGLFRHFMH